MDFLETIWGSGEKLGITSMSVRAFCAFIIMLILIRLGGMRIFGKQSAFDSIVTIMLGAIISRGVVGASPFLSTVAACTIIVFVHRMLSIATVHYQKFGAIIKGHKLLLFEDNHFNHDNLYKAGISENDVHERVRIEMNEETLANIQKVFLERNGSLSFIKRNPQ
jgi:uncharacterized membrane protein YcaP (DUF421 family)